MALRERLERGWYEGGRLPGWTLALAWLYASVVRGRAWCWRVGLKRAVRLPVPVVVVGNLSVGGTGKTPLTLALARMLSAHGYRPGVVSRGYGGTRREPMRLDPGADAAEVGDEPALIRAHGIEVAIGRDRPAAARLLVDAGCDVLIADDGLQHYRLARDVEICVIDGVRRFGNGRLLPAGPLREPLRRLARVDFRVCNGGVAAAGEVPMRLVGTRVLALCGGAARARADFAGRRVHAVAAIGHPARFFDSLRADGIEVVPQAFADHHVFTAAELDFGDGLPVLMTDKDAIKCAAFAGEDWWRVPVEAELPASFLLAVRERVAFALAARDRPPPC